MIKCQIRLSRGSSSRLLLGLRTFAETVLETALNILQVSHAASTGGLSALTLFGPVERSDLGSGITTLSTGLLLLVERAVATTTT